MSRKLIITKIEGKIWTVLFDDNKIVELQCTDVGQESRGYQIGDIFVGRIKNIVSNIDAAFVEIAEGQECYFSLTENKNPIFTKKVGKKPFCVGDELLVQVTKEAVKTKVPTVSSKLSFTGKYAVLTTGDTRIGVSNKLDKDSKERLTAIVEQYASGDYGIVVRTNAKDASDELLINEVKSLIASYQEMIETAHTRICYSRLKSSPKPYLLEMQNVYQEGLEEILVEEEDIYEEIRLFLEEYQPEDLDKLRFYKDSLLPLHKLYNIEKYIEDALKERVWLKSGAYLVIQPTEALTVIDVNSGKNISKKKEDEAVFKLNVEAAQEAARQIRLRNLSGIILIDFINMQKREMMDQLLHIFEKELSKDPIATTLVDVTKLQLVEVTRKKVRKPLYEAIRD